jgi:hypothetical protein
MNINIKIMKIAKPTLISDTPIIPYLKALTIYRRGLIFETICQVLDKRSTE